MWIQNNFFKYATGIALVLLILLLVYLISPLFSPILWFAAAVLLPILFSTFLYYILRPLVNLISRFIPRFLAILLIYSTLVISLVVLFLVEGPQLINEINFLTTISPEKIDTLKVNLQQFIKQTQAYLSFTSIPGIEDMFLSIVQTVNTFLYKLTLNMITTLTSIAIALALTPFVLYYFFRDDALFSQAVLRFIPKEFNAEVRTILEDIDETLSEFILAQMTIAAVVGFCLFCGYVLIGLPQALALALFAMIFYVIPILGTFIAIIPALIMGMTVGFSMTVKVILVMFIAHFLEANLLTPRLMSQRLKIHPLTIILLLLAAGTLYGLLGLLLVTPTYAILKVIVWNLYKISRLRYRSAKSNPPANLPE